MPKVVHCKIAPPGSFIYVGRGRCPVTGQVSKWGNPFSHKDGTMAAHKVATVEEAVAAFDRWLDTQPELLAALPELTGYDLACWCARRGDEPCHARVLLRRANPGAADART